MSGPPKRLWLTETAINGCPTVTYSNHHNRQDWVPYLLAPEPELVEALKAELEMQEYKLRGSTHWEGCEDTHPGCRRVRLYQALLEHLNGETT